MSLGAALAAELVGHTATAGYVAGIGGAPNRIYPLVIPQKVPHGAAQLPGVVYSITSVERQLTYCGTSGLIRTRLSVDCYDDNYDDARALAAAVRAVLLDFTGLLGGTEDVRHMALETEIDLQDPEPGLYRVNQSWAVWHAPAD